MQSELSDSSPKPNSALRSRQPARKQRPELHIPKPHGLGRIVFHSERVCACVRILCSDKYIYTYLYIYLFVYLLVDLLKDLFAYLCIYLSLYVYLYFYVYIDMYIYIYIYRDR